MVTCCAIGCVNRSDRSHRRGVTFHKFPSEPIRRDLWVQAVQRGDWQPALRSVLCSAHFKEEDFDRSSTASVRLKPYAIPSIFPDPTNFTKSRKFVKSGVSPDDYGSFSLSARLCDISAAALQEDEVENSDQIKSPIKRKQPEVVTALEESFDNEIEKPNGISKISRIPSETSGVSESLMPHKFLEVQLDENEPPPEILSRVMKCNKSLSLTIYRIPSDSNRKTSPAKIPKLKLIQKQSPVVKSETPVKVPALPHEFLEVQLQVQEDCSDRAKLALNSNEISIIKVPNFKANLSCKQLPKDKVPFNMSKELSSMFNFEMLKKA